MDSAIATAVAQVRTETIQHMRAVQAAEADVAPLVGKLAVAQDSVEGVYAAALKSLGHDINGVHPSAYQALYRMAADSAAAVKKADAAGYNSRPYVAQDSADVAAEVAAFDKNLSRIRSV